MLHPSGRIWLAGAWEPDEIAVGRNGEATVAVMGDCSLTPSEVDRRTKAVRTVADVESMLADAAGTFLVLACVRGRFYGRGPLSGSDRIFTTIHKGHTLIADRARTLAWLIKAPIDPHQVAARLCSPGLPPPLDDATLWTGICGVHPGHAAMFDERGNSTTRPWWLPPELLPSLDAGAHALRVALERAVRAHLPSAGGTIGADLSGGFDSTSLCYLAAEAGAKLATATIDWSAPGSEDAHYAEIAARSLPIRDQLVFRSTELPAQFSGLDARQEPSDEPSFLVRSRLEQRHISAAMVALGASCRLSGHGGDDVVQPPATAITGALRRHPFSGLRHLSATGSLHRWSTKDTLVAALERGSYESWVRSGVSALDGVRRRPARWGRPAALPPWAARNAHAVIGDMLQSADAPGVTDPAQHAWLHQIQQSGRVAGQLREICAQVGLPCHTPFLDQAVIEACLATPPEIAHDPRAYKPLLAAAMRDLLPDEIRRRTTKDHCLPEWHSGLRGNQRLLAEWCEDSRLVDMGLVDREPLRRAVLNPELLGGRVAAIEKTLALETWLRDVEEIAEPAYLREE